MSSVDSSRIFATPEIEHLHPHALRRRREEQIARVEIAVDDALRVRVAEAVRSGAEELDHLLERAALLTDRAADGEVVRERAPLHPLEDHVRDEGAGVRLPGACGDAPDDVEVALRQSVEDAALVAEALRELIDELRRERRRQLQALDRDRLLEPEVMPAIDRAESALSDQSIDPELRIEDLPHDPERIDRVSLHEGTISAPAPLADR